MNEESKNKKIENKTDCFHLKYKAFYYIPYVLINKIVYIILLCFFV